MPQKTTEIRSRNGRWPIGFLANQLVGLNEEQAREEGWDWEKRISASTIEDASASSEPTDPGDKSVRMHAQFINDRLSRLVSDKIQRIRAAIKIVSADIKKEQGKHQYGVCECGNFIRSDRLISDPWVTTCIACQTIIEQKMADIGIGIRATPTTRGFRSSHPTRDSLSF